MKTLTTILLLVLLGLTTLSAQSDRQVPQQNLSKTIPTTVDRLIEPSIDNNYLIDNDSLHAAAMYQVVNKVSTLTFTGESSVLLPKKDLAENSFGVLTLSADPTEEYCCQTCVNKFFIKLTLHAGGDKHTHELGELPQQVQCVVKLEGLDNSNIVTFTINDITLSIGGSTTENDVENVYYKSLLPEHYDACGSPGTTRSIRVTITSITLPSAFAEYVRLDAETTEEYAVDIKSCYDNQPAKVIATVYESGAITNNKVCFSNCVTSSHPTGFPGLPSIKSNPVLFQWNLVSSCSADYPAYQFQILRLYNTDGTKEDTPYDIVTVVDWSHALNLTIEGKQKTLYLTLPEGIGYYTWRVRPIGNKNGGVINPQDWGEWSEAPAQGTVNITPCYANYDPQNIDEASQHGVFYYDPDNITDCSSAGSFVEFHHDKNWSYSRAFTEDNTREPKIFESITYTDGIGQPEQKQTISQADNNMQDQHFLYDFSGRQSIQAMTAPVTRTTGAQHLHLDYLPEQILNSSNNLYSPNDVESGLSGTPEPIAATSPSHVYFSNNNPDISVPNAAGFPYAQTLYYPDGRVKEVAGIGPEHSVGQGRTSKMYYSGVSEQELVSVFGNEAPLAVSVSKVVTIDPDKIATVQYINKEGQTIATCIVDNGELKNGETSLTEVSNGWEIITQDHPSHALLNLIGEKVNNITTTEELHGGEYASQGVLRTYKAFTFVKPTDVKLSYQVTPKLLSISGCTEYCADCQFKVTIRYYNRETPSTIVTVYSEVINPTTPGNCTSQYIQYPFTDLVVSGLGPGTFIFERIIEPVGKPDIAAYLGSPLPVLEDIYSTLFSTGNAEAQLLHYNTNYGNNHYPKDNSNDPWFATEFVDCEKMDLPKELCEEFTCTENKPDFELYLFQEIVNSTIVSGDVTTGRADCNLNTFFKDWKTGNGKFPEGVSAFYSNYGRGLFNTIVENMLKDNTCAEEYRYKCEDLWNAWRLAVGQYKTLKEQGTVTSKVNGVYFDLLETFLDNTGRKLCTRVAPLPEPNPLILSTYDPYYGGGTYLGYLRYPYKLLPVDNYGNCWILHIGSPSTPPEDCCPTGTSTDVISGKANIWMKYDVIRQCIRGESLDLSDNKFLKDKHINDCTMPPCLYANALPGTDCKKKWDAYISCIVKIGDLNENLCRSQCEQRRDEFAQIILAEYANPQHPPFGTTAVPKYLTWSYRPDPQPSDPDHKTQVLPGSTNELKLDELLCRVELLIEDCQKDCDAPRIVFDRTTGNFSTSTNAKYDAYGIRVRGVPEVDLYNYEAVPPEYRHCPVGFDYLIHDNTFLQTIAHYLTEQYRLKSESLTKDEIVDFGAILLQFLDGYGINEANQNVPPCFRKYLNESNQIVINAGYADLQITVYPHTKGTFSVASFDECGCFLRFDGERPLYSTHQWVNELNSFANDIWGMKLQNPGVMNADSVNTMALDSTAFYTAIRYHSGDSLRLHKHDSLEARASLFMERMRFYNVNGRTDSSRAFYPDSVFTSGGYNPSVGIVMTDIYDIFHVSNPADSLYHDTWRTYNFGLMLPELSSTDNSKQALNFQLGVWSKTGGKLDTIAFMSVHSFPVHVNEVFTYPTTAGAFELRRFESAPESDSTALRFTDVIGKFGQTADAYLMFTDFVTGDRHIYEQVRFYNTYTKIIGGSGTECQNFSLCTPGQCHVCVKWKERTYPTELPNVPPYKSLTCAERQIAEIKRIVAEKYNAILTKLRKRFEREYQQDCMSGDIADLLKINFKEKYYHYTLYYYDRNGNLVQTVPPKGVDIPKTTDIITREDVGIPDHALRSPSSKTPNYSSTYDFNTLKLPIEENTVDGGSACFAYSSHKLLRYSQSAAQRPTTGNQRYSYNIYDNLGRIIEIGEAIPGTGAVACSTLHQRALSENLDSSPLDLGHDIQFVSTTQYTTPAPALPDPYSSVTQRNLRNRVSYTVYDQDGDYTFTGGLNGGTTTDDRVITYYSYDPYGNVEWVIQDIPAFNGTGNITERLVSKVDYQYDVISSRVNTLSFRVGYNDRVYQRYSYDRNDRLASVETSRDGVIWDKDATYEHYSHGPLKRLAIGEDSLQGVDYTYTIQGQIKAINHPSLTTANDPGGDGGDKSTLQTAFAKDAFGMTLNYYPGDFRRLFTGTATAQSLFNSQDDLTYDVAPNYLSPSANLYGGNIASWAEQVYNPTGTTVPAQPTFVDKQTGSLYRYDVIGRIKKEAFQKSTGSAFTADDSYDTEYAYDANSNITNLTRRVKEDNTSSAEPMDNLAYNYDNSNNRLRQITDAVSDAAVADKDLDDQSSSSNYSYDPSGNLTSDIKSGVTDITWTPFNKVDKVEMPQKVIRHLYNSTGNIVRKYVNAGFAGEDIVTYYIYDAAGKQLLAVYEQKRPYNDNDWSGHALTLKEAPIHGSKRIGMLLPNANRTDVDPEQTTFTRTLKKKNYELTDHLGNVRSVFTDMKQIDPSNTDAFLPDATTRNYYYPFGMERPGMTTTIANSNYRFGYNGMEKMDDIYGKGNALDFGSRILDPRVGRWLSLDPMARKYPSFSPYNFALDRPVSLKDADGKFATDENGNIIVQITSTSKDIWRQGDSYVNDLFFYGYYGKILTDKGREIEVFMATDNTIYATKFPIVAPNLYQEPSDNSYNCTGNAFLSGNLTVNATNLTPEILAQDENYVWGLDELPNSGVPGPGDVGTYSVEMKNANNEVVRGYLHFEKFITSDNTDSKGGTQPGPFYSPPNQHFHFNKKKYPTIEYEIIHKLTPNMVILEEDYQGPLLPHQVRSSSGIKIAPTQNKINKVTPQQFEIIKAELKAKANGTQTGGTQTGGTQTGGTQTGETQTDGTQTGGTQTGGTQNQKPEEPK